MPKHKKKKFPKIRKYLKRYKYHIRYGLILGGFAALWYWDPTVVIVAQERALEGITNITDFLKALYVKLDELLEIILAGIALWAI